MHSRNYSWGFNTVRLGCAGVLLASSNWNNAANAGISYQNSNNRSANVNNANGRHVELKTHLRSPEQQPIQNQIRLVKHKATHPGVLVHNGRFSRHGRTDT